MSIPSWGSFVASLRMGGRGGRCRGRRRLQSSSPPVLCRTGSMYGGPRRSAHLPLIPVPASRLLVRRPTLRRTPRAASTSGPSSLRVRWRYHNCHESPQNPHLSGRYRRLRGMYMYVAENNRINSIGGSMKQLIFFLATSTWPNVPHHLTEICTELVRELKRCVAQELLWRDRT